MTPEQMRIKIAEACGWRNIHEDKHSDNLWGEFQPTRGLSEVPNYPESLDAMAEARRTLDNFEWSQYTWELRKLLATGTKETPYTVNENQIINATPLQHAEAFLRAKGLLEDGE